jgi:hypothetical protein
VDCSPDALDDGNSKLALQICTKVLKKYPESQLGRVRQKQSAQYKLT